MPNVVNLIDQRFGRLLVKRRSDKNAHNKSHWECLCDCGVMKIVSGGSLRSGNTRSCGCLFREAVVERESLKLTGKKFGRLLVLEKSSRKGHNKTYWKCLCDCGEIIHCSSGSLQGERTRSCGCFHIDVISKDKNRLVGQKFHKLTVLSFAGIRGSNQMWLCECECGSKPVVASGNLHSGASRSCGCIKSRAEEEVAVWLTQKGIPFEREKRFADCKDKGALPFDFYVETTDKKIVIECQGRQHYESIPHFGGEPALVKRVSHDLIKERYCERKNVSLIAIKFSDDAKSVLSSVFN